jgi:hypothetical protein
MAAGVEPSRLAVTNFKLICLRSVLKLLVTAYVLPGSLILSTLRMEVIISSETSVIKRTTGRHSPEDGILHSHRRENLKSYIALTGWTP